MGSFCSKERDQELMTNERSNYLKTRSKKEEEKFATNSQSEKIKFFHFGTSSKNQDFNNDLHDSINRNKIIDSQKENVQEKKDWKLKEVQKPEDRHGLRKAPENGEETKDQDEQKKYFQGQFLGEPQSFCTPVSDLISSDPDEQKKYFQGQFLGEPQSFCTPVSDLISSDPERFLPTGEMFVINFWFFTADWPAPNYDFSAELKRRSLEEVELENWGNEESVVEKDLKIRKVFAVPLHRGVFQDIRGDIWDLRPRENFLTFQTLMKKSLSELLKLWIFGVEQELNNFEKKLAHLPKAEPKCIDLKSCLFKSWWFWCKEWPTESDYDQKAFQRMDWKIVDLNEWESTPGEDKDELLKAFHVPLHPGVIQNVHASLINCKPKKTENYKDLDSKTFYELLKLYSESMRDGLREFVQKHQQLLS